MFLTTKLNKGPYDSEFPVLPNISSLSSTISEQTRDAPAQVLMTVSVVLFRAMGCNLDYDDLKEGYKLSMPSSL